MRFLRVDSEESDGLYNPGPGAIDAVREFTPLVSRRATEKDEVRDDECTRSYLGT